MQSDDLTLRVLIEIRDEIRTTNQRIDQTNARLDQTNARLDHANTRLDHTVLSVNAGFAELGPRIIASETRTATAIGDVAGSIREVHTLLRDRFDLRDRVERCERDIEQLKRAAG